MKKSYVIGGIIALSILPTFQVSASELKQNNILVNSDIQVSDKELSAVEKYDVMVLSAEGLQCSNGICKYINGDNTYHRGFKTIADKTYYFSILDGRMLTGWIQPNGYGPRYYADINGVIQKGIKLIDGKTYCFDDSGAMLTGFRKIEGKTYYFSTMDGRMLTGWIQPNGYGPRYYADSNGVIQKGIIKIAGKTYCFDDSGASLTGLRTFEGETYYFSIMDGRMLTGWIQPNGYGPMYYADSNGSIQKGIKIIGTKTYCFDDSGAMLTGFRTFVGKTYYFSTMDGRMLTGFVQPNGYGPTYYFDANGVIQTGWQTIDGQKYLYDKDGVPYSGFKEIDGKTHYFSYMKGRMLTGWIQPNGYGPRYYADANGIIQKGVKTIDGKTYCFGDDGGTLTGFRILDGKKYYFSTMDGRMLTGFVQPNGYGPTYRFDENGVMLTGWQTIGDQKYLYDKDGVPYSGFKTIDGKTYYFSYMKGRMLTGWIQPNGHGPRYYADANGIIQKGVKTIDGKKYCFGDDGGTLTGFRILDGKKYYFSTMDGRMLTGWFQPNGYGPKYYADSNGVIR